jgi:membrane protein required for colicin V production
VIAFAAIFLIAFLLVKILERLLHEGLEAARLDRLDRVLGLVLGAVEGLLAASIILIVLQIQPLFDVKALLAGSVFAKTILPIVGPEVTKALTPALKSVGPILPALKKP